MDAQHLTGWLRERWLDAYRALVHAQNELDTFADGNSIGTGLALAMTVKRKTEKARDT